MEFLGHILYVPSVTSSQRNRVTCLGGTINMKYTIAMTMDRDTIMRIHNLIRDIRMSFSWGMVTPFTSENYIVFEQLNVDICNWLINRVTLEGMDMVILDHLVRSLECMARRKLYPELVEVGAYEQISDLKKRFWALREIFTMDRSC